MNRIIDKIIILAISLYAVSSMLGGTAFMICIYAAIIFSALNYYLIRGEKSNNSMKPESDGEWCAFFLEIIVAVIAVFYAPAVSLVPIVIYDSTRSRNYIAGVLSVIAVINSFLEYGPYRTLFIILISVLAIILSIKSERLSILSKDYRRIRDDSAEKNTRLQSQNMELINARDTEIYNAQLSERNRIAREIHDNVGHTLSRAILQMGALLAIHKEEPVHGQLEEVRQTLDSAMNNIRSSVHDLHDDSIDVKASIGQMAELLKPNHNLNVDIDIGNNMARPVKYAVIGITKESISNINKHSKNKDVTISLNEHPSMYQLVIHDYDGSKENAEQKKSSSDSASDHEVGMGLENIRSRVESVNGTLTISTDNGFRIFVSIPK